jgi:hypothetical protein
VPPGAGRIHGRDQTVFFERGPILRPSQIEPDAALPCRLLAHVFERHATREDTGGDALFQSSLALNLGWLGGSQLRCGERSRGESGKQFSASHGFYGKSGTAILVEDGRAVTSLAKTLSCTALAA